MSKLTIKKGGNLIIQRAKQKVKTEKEIPHLILVLEPLEVRDLQEIILDSRIKNTLSTNTTLIKVLKDYLEEDKKGIPEKVLEEGKVEVIN